MKENVQENQVILHVDYSESYYNTQQYEIQSAYFGNSTLTIFTACGYILDHRKEFSKRSVGSDHSRIAALTCIDMVLKGVQKETKVKRLMVWSDKCASQFRSRFAFKSLSTYHPQLLLEWSYNKAHHGKGPMDGMGGTIKNVVFRQVKSKKVDSNSPIEFCDAANKFILSIKCLYQPETSLLEEPHDIENEPVISNTLQIHRLVREIREDGKAAISYFNLSCDVIQFTLKITKISLNAVIMKMNFNHLQ